MRIGVPAIGTGEHECSPHGRPKQGCHATDEKIPLRAARPPIVRDANLASLMCSDGVSIGDALAVRQGLARCSRRRRAASSGRT